MNKYLLLFFIFIQQDLLACPTCLGLNPNDKYFTYVILFFIALATCVILFLLRTCFKYKDINKVIESNQK